MALIPVGNLRVQARGPGSLRFAKADNANETMQVHVDVRVSEDGPFCGETRVWSSSFTDAAAEFTFEGLRALCPTWTSDDISDLEEISKRGDFAEVEAYFKQEEYQGKVRDKCAYLRAPGATRGKPVASDELRTFANRMRTTAQKTPQTGATKLAPKSAAPAQRTEPTRQSDPGWDDVPPPSDADAPPARNPFGGKR